MVRRTTAVQLYAVKAKLVQLSDVSFVVDGQGLRRYDKSSECATARQHKVAE